MSISKNVLLGCLCFFIVFWHVFKKKSKTKLLNPSPKPLTFPQGYLFFLGFYMVSNGTRDLEQAETTTNKFAMPRGEKWQRVRSCHFSCQSLKITTNQESKTPRNQKNKNKKNKIAHPKGRGSDAVCCCFFSCFFGFLIYFFCLCKKKRNCKGEIAKSKLTHCRRIKHLKRRAPTVACSFADRSRKTYPWKR